MCMFYNRLSHLEVFTIKLRPLFSVYDRCAIEINESFGSITYF